MAFVVSTLVDYVIENQDSLLSRSTFGSRTADLVASEGTLMTGVKFAEQINLMSTDAIFQDGSGCTRVSSGTTTLTQRKVTVGEIAVVEDLCVKQLNKKYMSKKLAKGSNAEGQKIPFEQEYAELKSDTIAEQLEVAQWQGDTSHGNANLNKFDGYLKLIDAATGVISANTSALLGISQITSVGGGITESNVKAVVKAMWKALPAALQGRKDIRIFCGWDVFSLFIAAYTDQNLFNFAPKGSEMNAENGEIIIPGTNYKLTAVHGLDATQRLIATRMPNLAAATDLENEEEQWSIMEDQFKDFLRFKVQFKYGVNVAFPNEIVSFKLA
jgi:hypothetical protein